MKSGKSIWKESKQNLKMSGRKRHFILVFGAPFYSLTSVTNMTEMEK